MTRAVAQHLHPTHEDFAIISTSRMWHVNHFCSIYRLYKHHLSVILYTDERVVFLKNIGKKKR
jgi:hypothetical protein